MIKLFMLILATFITFSAGGCREKAGNTAQSEKDALNQIKITVLYDNYPHQNGLTCDWGFACLIETDSDTILFDSGTDGNILCANMDSLGINASSIGYVFLSHQHRDHVGGISRVLERNPEVKVWCLSSFSQDLRDELSSNAASVEEIAAPGMLLDNIHTSGEMGSKIKEQSLILETREGLMIITGCAHPGIVNIVDKAISLTDETPYLVLGGFHLRSGSDAEIENVISKLKKLGVRKAGPTHCSGDRTRALFKQAFGDNYLQIGAGWSMSM